MEFPSVSRKPSGGDPRPLGFVAPWSPGQELGKEGWLKWRPPSWAVDEVERLMKLFSKTELLRGQCVLVTSCV